MGKGKFHRHEIGTVSYMYKKDFAAHIFLQRGDVCSCKKRKWPPKVGEGRGLEDATQASVFISGGANKSHKN